MTDNNSQITDAPVADDSTQLVVHQNQTELATDATEPTYKHIRKAVTDKTVWYVLADLMTMPEKARRDRIERQRNSEVAATSRDASRIMEIDTPLGQLPETIPPTIITTEDPTVENPTQDAQDPPVVDHAIGHVGEDGTPNVWEYSPRLGEPAEAPLDQRVFSHAEMEGYYGKAKLLTRIMADNASKLEAAGLWDAPSLVLTGASFGYLDEEGHKAKVAVSTREGPKLSVEAIFEIGDSAWEQITLLSVKHLFGHPPTAQSLAYDRQEDLLRAQRLEQSQTQATQTTQAD